MKGMSKREGAGEEEKTVSAVGKRDRKLSRAKPGWVMARATAGR